MKVLYLAFGGAGLFRYSLLVAQAACDALHGDLLILASKRDIDRADRFVVASGLSEFLRTFSNPSGRRSLRKIFDVVVEVVRSRVQVIHDTAGPASRHTWTLWIIAKPFVRLVVTIHDPLPHAGMRGFWLGVRTRLAGLLADQVVVHGTKTKSQAIRAGVPMHKICIVSHPEMGIYGQISYPDATQNIVHTCGTQYVLWFGAVRPNKGLTLLPEIFSTVWAKLPGTRFVIAGKLPPPGVVKKKGWAEQAVGLKNGLTSDSRVTWIDRFIRDEEIGQLFRGASIVILPYSDATQSGVLMTALGLGVPVVATPVGDIPEVLQDGVTGRLIKHEPKEFGLAIVDLLKAPATLEKMGLAARDVSTRFFSTEALGPVMRHLYSGAMVQHEIV